MKLQKTSLLTTYTDLLNLYILVFFWIAAVNCTNKSTGNKCKKKVLNTDKLR